MNRVTDSLTMNYIPAMTIRLAKALACVFAALTLLSHSVIGAETDLGIDKDLIIQMAEQGDAEAQSAMGLMYQYGEGVTKDYREAAKWYRKAAEQGLALAQLRLGAIYDGGKGVSVDHKEAAKWYRKAAEQGYPKSQLSLGVMYSLGDGVSKDYVKAYAWINVASANGNKNAVKAREMISEYMSSRRIRKAQKLAKEYFQKYQPKK